MESEADERVDERERMVRTQVEARGIADPRLLAALRCVPRHRFLPADDPLLQAEAYEDGPLPIGHGQTISQPFVVALMTDALELSGTERVLEVGSGCGYQTAILAELAAEVHGLEIVPELAGRAAGTLAELGVTNASVTRGDGSRGLDEHAPYDAILVAAAPREVPEALLDQLAEGGRLVLPVGDWDQELVLLVKQGGVVERRDLGPVRFVPMTGAARRR